MDETNELNIRLEEMQFPCTQTTSFKTEVERVYNQGK